MGHSTTDSNFHEGGDTVYLWVKNASGDSTGSDAESFSVGGNGSFKWSNLGYTVANQPSFPINLEFHINDDDDPALASVNDSVFYYNVTSSTNDIFDNGNLFLSEGKYIDIQLPIKHT